MKVDLELDRGASARIAAMPGGIMPALFSGMKKAMFLAEREAKLNLSGRVLHRRTGRLRNSILTRVTQSTHSVTGEIGSNVVYARIHELGGVITPKKAKALKFYIPGVGWRTSQKVTIPSRPYLRPALMDSLPEIRVLIAEEVRKLAVA